MHTYIYICTGSVIWINKKEKKQKKKMKTKLQIYNENKGNIA